MKKHFAIIYLLTIMASTLLYFSVPTIEAATINNEGVIPEDSIRLRILANSDSEADQDVKVQIRDEVVANMNNWVGDASSKEEAVEIVNKHIPEIEQIALDVLMKNNIKETVKVEYTQTEFPTKMYGDYIYPAGTYDALKISIGSASGANWWCVLYPPMCFLDFDSGTAVPVKETKNESKPVKEKSETDEVKFLSKEVVDKIFN